MSIYSSLKKNRGILVVGSFVCFFCLFYGFGSINYSVSSKESHFRGIGSEEIEKSIERKYGGGDRDNSSERSRPRIFTFIHTMPANHKSRAKAVRDTWAPRFDKFVFATIGADDSLGDHWVFNYSNAKHPFDDRIWLWSRIRGAIQKTHDEYLNDFDWFMKTDDDSFVVVENLRSILSKYNPNEPWLLGEMVTLNGFRSKPYPSGGSGYAFSREALKRFVNVQKDPKSGCTTEIHEMEDIHIGECMAAAGIEFIGNVNEKGEHSMISINLKDIYPPQGQHSESVRAWYTQHTKHPVKVGESCCSEDLISVHYTSPEDIYIYDYLLYKVKINKDL